MRSLLRSAALTLACRIVRGYPKPWRARYESEVVALFDDVPPRLRDVPDLLRGLVVERARSLFEPGDRPALSATLVLAGGLARGVIAIGVAALAGFAARRWLGEVPGLAGPAATLDIAVRFTVCVLIIRGQWRRMKMAGAVAADLDSTTPAQPPVRRPVLAFSSRWSGYGWLMLLVSGAFLGAWSSETPLIGLVLAMHALLFANQVSDPPAWRSVMTRAIVQRRAAEHEVSWARMELARCEQLVAQGTSAPLQDARDAVARLTRAREEATATLHGLGYRATISGPSSCSTRSSRP